MTQSILLCRKLPDTMYARLFSEVLSYRFYFSLDFAPFPCGNTVNNLLLNLVTELFSDGHYTKVDSH